MINSLLNQKQINAEKWAKGFYVEDTQTGNDTDNESTVYSLVL